ncbi:MAG: hypothetical protein COA85_13470 [Robiginitomaculum sp.]|nr:MAG: hypothetical protein COA85_13470 [Robiginitomaculum sp.]
MCSDNEETKKIIALNGLHELAINIEKDLQSLYPMSSDLIFAANLLKYGLSRHLVKVHLVKYSLGDSMH